MIYAGLLVLMGKLRLRGKMGPSLLPKGLKTELGCSSTAPHSLLFPPTPLCDPDWTGLDVGYSKQSLEEKKTRDR